MYEYILFISDNWDRISRRFCNDLRLVIFCLLLSVGFYGLSFQSMILFSLIFLLSKVLNFAFLYPVEGELCSALIKSVALFGIAYSAAVGFGAIFFIVLHFALQNIFDKYSVWAISISMVVTVLVFLFSYSSFREDYND
jgi:hypothetical protein